MEIPYKRNLTDSHRRGNRYYLLIQKNIGKRLNKIHQVLEKETLHDAKHQGIILKREIDELKEIFLGNLSRNIQVQDKNNNIKISSSKDGEKSDNVELSKKESTCVKFDVIGLLDCYLCDDILKDFDKKVLTAHKISSTHTDILKHSFGHNCAKRQSYLDSLNCASDVFLYKEFSEKVLTRIPKQLNKMTKDSLKSQ